jgi:TRAP-type C4-dicarboxylate transport system permease small subunit
MATGVIPALWNSSKITLRVLSRAARQFFHEAMGALFATFALYGAVAAWRQWHSKVAAWLLGFALVYAVLMAFFAVTSFRRARRVR